MSKNVIQPIYLLTVGDMSQATLTSSTVDLMYLDGVGLQFTWTGSPTGTIEVQCSNDNTNFYALTFSPTITQPSGSASGSLANMTQLPYRYLRVFYTKGSGTGSLTVIMTSKEV